jgi:hypothetical protein
MAIKLGTIVTDTITGFKGVAISRTEFLHGCVRIGVQPKKLTTDGKRADVDFIDEKLLKENDPKTTPELNPILGTTVTDSITGLKGTAVARTQFINSVERVAIQPKALHEGRPVDAVEFDEPQLKEYKAPEKTKPGGPGLMARPNRMASRN